VLLVDTLVAEDAAQLVDLFVAAHQQFFERELERNPQLEIVPQRVVVRLEGARLGPAGGLQNDRRFDFQKTAIFQEVPDVADYPRPLAKYVAYLGVDDQVEVALAVADLFVFDTVPLVGQRPERLGQRLPVFHLDRQLAGAGGKNAATNANQVANVKLFQLVVVGNLLFVEVKLYAAALVE